MEHGSVTLRYQETGQPTGTLHANSTRAVGVPQAIPPSPWFASTRRRRAVIWGITSTALSTLGLLALALFEQYNGMLSELRGDLKHFNDTAGEYVKKDRMNKCIEIMKSCYKELSAAKAERGQLQRELRESESAREQMARQVQRFRERLAYLEGIKAANPTAHAEDLDKQIGSDDN